MQRLDDRFLISITLIDRYFHIFLIQFYKAIHSSRIDISTADMTTASPEPQELLWVIIPAYIIFARTS